MLNSKIEAAINAQINAEMWSAYLYLSMSAWCAKEGKPGMANWFEIQFREEQDHARIFFNYVLQRGHIEVGFLGAAQIDKWGNLNSSVIGDRETDAQLATNLGCKALVLGRDGLTWDKIAELLFAGERTIEIRRTTKETDVFVKLNLDGTGKCDISTGLGFFDHMLEQIGRHGMCDLTIHTKGDLNVDEHHTIEDTAIVLGECLLKALGNKRGIERYGYCLPMDDCLCQVALDFGGRAWLQWDTEFRRERIGDVPTEMFMHFFKSLSDAAQMNLAIKASGTNEHHKIEGIFKALAKSIKMAVKRDIYHYELPSTKGML